MSIPVRTVIYQVLALCFLVFSIMMFADALSQHQPFRAILGGVLVVANIAIIIVNGHIRERWRGHIGNPVGPVG